MPLVSRGKTTPYSKIRVQSKRILLRPYKLTDFKRCRESHGERRPPINEFDAEIPTPSSRTYEKFKKRIEDHRKRGKLKFYFNFAIFSRGDEVYLGQIDLFTINQQLRWGNLGYHIQNQHWGKGYATEACALALKVAFKYLGFHRIEAGAEIENRASIKVAKKIGMIKEGKRIKFFPDKGGIDLLIFGTNSIDYKY